MKLRLSVALCALLVAGTMLARPAIAQKDTKSATPPLPPIIIRAQPHTMHLNDFMVRMSKDRTLAADVHRKGIDLAFTEWMQRDHPEVFRKECIKQSGELAADYKGTNYMTEFDNLIAKRPDLRASVKRLGHDAAFAEWLRTERPNVYREHFGLGANNQPIKKADKKKTSP